MNATEFLPFMGHSSIYPPFDEFLTANGVVWRPKSGRTLNTTFFIAGTGLHMSFDFAISAAEKGFDVKSDGSYIFTGFEIAVVAENKKNGSYGGVLPHGLLASDTRQSVEQKLGTPKRRNKNSDNYYLDRLVWTVAFGNDIIEAIQFSVPSNGWRQHGICP
jgi:hypothetical protein